MEYKNFRIEEKDKIAWVSFNRPEKANALDRLAWEEMQAIFEELGDREDIRVIVLSGEGKHFCSGIDVSLLMSVGQEVKDSCSGRRGEKIRKLIHKLQSTVNAIENCSKPVLAAIHGACIGGGLDIAVACDMRYATEDAYFSVKEIDMGMVADLGSLQRLTYLVSEGVAREMAYTGDRVGAAAAKGHGLVNQVMDDREELIEKVGEIAGVIAEKSPLSIRGTKAMMNYSRDHNLADGLEYISVWNAAMLLSEDLSAATMAAMTKKKAEFRG